MVQCKAQHATVLHTGRKTGNTAKLMSPRALISPLRSSFAMFIANQPSHGLLFIIKENELQVLILLIISHEYNRLQS